MSYLRKPRPAPTAGADPLRFTRSRLPPLPRLPSGPAWSLSRFREVAETPRAPLPVAVVRARPRLAQLWAKLCARWPRR